VLLKLIIGLQESGYAFTQAVVSFARGFEKSTSFALGKFSCRMKEDFFTWRQFWHCSDATL
jgi:hypothetical protein